MPTFPPHLLKGLYAITPDASVFSPSDMLYAVEAAVMGGARVVQYRDKSSLNDVRLKQAQSLKALCERHNVLFIVNDDVELAKTVGAHGVHLGKDDGNVNIAREFLGADVIIGVSCYDRLEQATQAQRDGADYVAFGRFFPSRTKPDAVQADIELLRQAKSALQIPIVAIGGITPDNGKLLTEAGADMLAVIDALFGAGNIKQAAAEFRACF